MPFLNVAVMLIGMPTMIQTVMEKLMIFNLECFITPVECFMTPRD